MLKTKEGIPNAKIRILCQGAAIDTLTDLEGKFLILNLPQENYQIEISAVGYPISTFPVQIVGDTNQIILPLNGMKLDSIDVNYKGSSIIYMDDSGKVKTAKSKRE